MCFDVNVLWFARLALLGRSFNEKIVNMERRCGKLLWEKRVELMPYDLLVP